MGEVAARQGEGIQTEREAPQGKKKTNQEAKEATWDPGLNLQRTHRKGS